MIKMPHPGFLELELEKIAKKYFRKYQRSDPDFGGLGKRILMQDEGEPFNERCIITSWNIARPRTRGYGLDVGYLMYPGSGANIDGMKTPYECVRVGTTLVEDPIEWGMAYYFNLKNENLQNLTLGQRDNNFRYGVFFPNYHGLLDDKHTIRAPSRIIVPKITKKQFISEIDKLAEVTIGWAK